MTDNILSQKYFEILLSLYSENKFQDTIDYGIVSKAGLYLSNSHDGRADCGSG